MTPRNTPRAFFSQKKTTKPRPRQGKRRSRADPSEEGELIYGLHAVRAALRNPRRRIATLWLTAKAQAALKPALDARSGASNASVPAITRAEPATLARMAPGGLHQGACALCAPLKAHDPLAFGKTARLLVALDGAQDPRNLGAVARACAVFGAQGILTPTRAAAPASPAAARAASGALERVPILRAASFTQTLRALQQEGATLLGLAHDAPTTLSQAASSLAPPARIVLVMGSEERGLRGPVRALCKPLVRIPMPGVEPNAADPLTLNLASATAIALYEITRSQRSSVG